MTHIPMRMCVACRQMQPAGELIRFVADKESQTIVADIHKKKFGRGAYLCRNAQCIGNARKKRMLERHLRYTAADGLYDTAEEMI